MRRPVNDAIVFAGLALVAAGLAAWSRTRRADARAVARRRRLIRLARKAPAN